MNDHASPGRLVRTLLSLLRSSANHRLSDAELHARRDEVNRAFAELGNDAFADALRSIYARAEAEERRKQRELRQASTRQRRY
jgi:hypothetical protein